MDGESDELAGRTRESLNALYDGDEVARRRVWLAVRERMADYERARRRRAWTLSAAAAAAVALLIAGAPFAGGALRDAYAPPASEQHRVAVDAVFQMLGGQGSGDEGMEAFVAYLVREAETGAQ
jgi:hypothetical protein